MPGSSGSRRPPAAMGTKTLTLLCAFLAILHGSRSADPLGQEFITVFMQNHNLRSGGRLSCRLYLTGQSNGTSVSISVNKHSFRKKITLNAQEMQMVEVDVGKEMVAGDLFAQTTIIQADHDIAVLSVNSKDLSSDSSIVYPLTELDTEYYIMTPPNGPADAFSEFAVVAYKDSAQVSIFPTSSITYQNRVYPAGKRADFYIEAYSAIQFQSMFDLSGTRILAQVPIAVLSGNTCAKELTNCNHVYEQLLPVSSWENVFIVPPMSFQGKYDLVYIGASQRTRVTYWEGPNHKVKDFTAGEVFNIKVSTATPLYINASAGIQVMYMSAGFVKDRIPYDPFLINVPDIYSYCTTYNINGRDNIETYALIVAKTSATTDIAYDKTALSGLRWKPIPGSEYSWSEQSFGKASGFPPHLVDHPNTPFGLMLFAMSNTEFYGESALCPSKPSCRKTKCRTKEGCSMKDDQPVCSPKSSAVCWAWGDPHYHSFDGKDYDFQGTCRYTMAQTCGKDTTLPVFNVEAKNENRGSTAVSYVKLIFVQVYGYNISAVRSEHGYIRVNDQRFPLPISLGNRKIQIFQSGYSVVIQTDFGLKVVYDWNIYLEINITSSFFGNVCGLCGNYNGATKDDFMTSAGTQADDSIGFAKSWKVDDGDSSCWDDCNGKCPECTSKQLMMYKGKEYCGLMSTPAGPFKMCNNFIDPKTYRDNCAYDMCYTGGFNQTMCNSFKGYADACQSKGRPITDWRSISGCTMQCMENSHYQLCGSPCQATCNDAATPDSCSDTCIETCQCNPGYILIEGKCLPKSNCGCVVKGGMQYRANQTFWNDDKCHERCFCNPDTNKLECAKTKCKATEKCDVVNGIRDCYPTSYGTCSASGDPHYVTFDGVKYDFQGTCLYLFAGLCNLNDDLNNFQVFTENDHRGSRTVAYTSAVRVLLDNADIEISNQYPDSVMVNGLRIKLPYSVENGKLSIFKSGWSAVVQTNFGLRVTFNWQSRVAVTIPGTYAGAVCGLCGDFNGSGIDELTMSNGLVTKNSTAFGQSWKVADIAGCTEDTPKECDNLTNRKQEQRDKNMACEIIVDPSGPFRDCLDKVDSEGYFTDCVYDFCLYAGRQEIICQAVASYAEACQEAGATIGIWRTASFCSPVCPGNSHYDVCTSDCAITCNGLSPPAGCTTTCKEGCACDEGYVLNVDQCVQISDCGCSFNGVYYKAGDTFLPNDQCSQQCTCNPGGIVACTNFSCGHNEECKVVDGVQTCSPVGNAMCSASGDPHYRSFDGVTFDFQGTCTYTLAKTCTDDSITLKPFAVSVQNEKWGHGKVSVTKLVAVDVYGYTLILEKGKKGLVKVNGVYHNIPLKLEHGKVRVLQYGINFLIKTDFGLQVNYDLVYHAGVIVPASYKGEMCGLCGNYNGNKTDDFLMPNMKQANNAADFGTAWKIPVAGVDCGEGCGGSGAPCPPCDDDKKKDYQKEDQCGIFNADDGPFKACYSQINPAAYFDNCIYDLCAGNGDRQILCQSIQAYVSECQAAGITMKAWRSHSFCPLDCPANGHYEICTDTCTSSCSHISDRSSCPTTCAEGCECDDGFFFDGQKCVTVDNCGCFENGEYYKPNQKILDINCTQVCTCNPAEGVTCEPQSCSSDEKCAINDGVVSCVPKDPCKSVHCRKKESCQMQDDTPVCVPESESACWRRGDLHYHNFDGKNFDFQGTCTYTLSKSCGPDNTLSQFNVQAKNEKRGSTAVSYVSLVTVQVYGVNISLDRYDYGHVKVNNQDSLLPIALNGGKVLIYQSGTSVTIQTDFTLKVIYNWNDYLEIRVSSSFQENVCGLCGNYNENGIDDFSTPSGDLAPTPVDFGKSWKVEDGDELCCHDCNENICTEEMSQNYTQNDACGLLILLKDGPFRECHAVIDPQAFFDTCVYDMCINDGYKAILCNALKAYTDACQRASVKIYEWRTITKCSMECPENSHYKDCGPACQATCNDAAALMDCSGPCMEMCECDTGFVLSEGTCIQKSDCGCSFQGRLYSPNDEFWLGDGCKTQCICNPSTGKVHCKPAECKSSEVCRVKNGIQDCYPTSYGTCSCSGDPHYITFDDVRYDFQGTCVYLFAGLCAQNKNLIDFQVYVQNEHRASSIVSYAKAVDVIVYNSTINISKQYPDDVMVNGLRIHLPYSANKGKLSIFKSGWSAVVQTNFGLRVTFNWESRVAVTVPASYAGATCGLCGNFDGNKKDELTMRNGDVTKNPNTFGQSWKEREVQECSHVEPNPCDDLEKEKAKQMAKKTECALIKDPNGPFRKCLDIVDPEGFFTDCVFDACVYEGRQASICQAVASYAVACQEAGVTIYTWRSAGFCSPLCPDNSHYEVCARDCATTCRGLSTPTLCTATCKEGCTCDEGFVLNSGQCVRISDCGCSYKGVYYKSGDTFFPSGQCSQQCTCNNGGSVECAEFSCGPNEECKVVDGVQKCEPIGSAMCSASGDPHYRSFDGLTFDFQGTCTYTLAKTCTAENSTLTPFAVSVENEKWGNGKVAVTKLVALEVYGYTLILEKKKAGLVKVNGILRNLPLSLESGKIRVFYYGVNVLVKTDFDLKVSYDLIYHATVTVPGNYKGSMCGLCGNYNGDKTDEFLRPDNAPAADVVAFASAWKVPVAGVSCDDGCGGADNPCAPCDGKKKDVFKQLNYCGILTAEDGPFSSCKNTIPPEAYFNNCIYDLCMGDGDQTALCFSIQSYVTACQAAGVTIQSWRSNSFCPLPCPENSLYKVCADTCSTSCSQISDRSSCPTSCSEGCECINGYFFDGKACVTMDDCGCFENGKYYKPGEVVIGDGCTQVCSCKPKGVLMCEDFSCAQDENCTIRDGTVICINTDPCKSINCRKMETCQVQNGVPVCVPNYSSSCWGWGDPHYHTFDGYNYDFQGTCSYTISKYCGSDSSLVPFAIDEKNDNRGNQAVSYVRLVNVYVYGYKISIYKGEIGRIRVNNELTSLPVSLEDGKITVNQNGNTATLQTDFGLLVSYEWNWHLIVTIPSSYYGTTCGLCGNLNQDPSDEMLTPDGTRVTTTVDWASSWKVKDHDLFCWDACQGNCPTCDESKIEQYESDQYCGLINKIADGAFRECHAKVDPGDFFDSCVYDVCINGGAQQFLCQALDSYARTCRKQGVKIYDWRTPSGCTLPCEENSHYESCGNACQASCADRTASANCTLPCVEACQCNAGYVRSVDKCVRIQDCGCTFNGLYIKPNEEFWSDDNCQVHCKCNPDLGMVECKNDQCKSSERCAVANGVRGCYPISYASCTASGDPHYNTFDGQRYDFQGTCVYQMAGMCSEDPTLTPFTVKVQNDHRGSKSVSFTKMVSLEVYKMILTLSRDYPRQIQVNGVLTALPFYYQSSKVVAYIGSAHAWVKTDFGLTLNYNWEGYARVMLPSTYAGAVCGLCGNYNQKSDDDMTMKNGNLATHAAPFGDSWKVGGVVECEADCGIDCPTCSEAEKEKYKSDTYCDIIVNENGPFSTCHHVIDPTPFFTDCLFDTCQYKGHYSALCTSISAYVSMCQEKGIEIQDWRTPRFCPPICPANSHYELCGSGCPATCSGLSSPAGCDALCGEGCVCNDGFILSGDKCVPIGDCGCIYKEQYYQQDQEFYPDGLCQERCRCGDGRVVTCQKAACGANEECQVLNGIQGCHPSGHGTCVASGDPHYLSFDGQAFDFQGSCTYTLATPCGDSQGLANFSVVVENESYGNGNVAVTRMVVVVVQGYTVAIERGMRWKVKVNRQLHNLPLILSGGDIVINQEGNHIVLQTSFGLKVLYDTVYYVRLQIPSTYQGQMCGLCGNFNGNRSDEFLLPNGELERNAQDFGTFWKIKVEGSKCSDGCGNDCPVCDNLRTAIYKRDVMCGLITMESGPFQNCHDIVQPTDYFNHCVYDMCAVDGNDGILCKSLQAYAAACQAAGADIGAWRDASNCKLMCPDNSHYELCTRTCDFTCAAMVSRSQCTEQCFEGCQCEEGYVFDGDSCVSMDTCGCVYNGMYLKVGESIVTQDCGQKCTCGASGEVQCEQVACREDEACTFKNSKRGCYKRDGQCTITSDALLTTFDGLTGQVTAGSSHEVASLCDLNAEAWFRTVVDIRTCSRPTGSSSTVHVYFHNAAVAINQDRECWVNGQQVVLPANISESVMVTVEEEGVVIEQASRVQVRLSKSGEVTIKVTEALGNTLCGACGNFNGEASDDLTLVDQKVAVDMSEVISYWRARDFSRCDV
ncbi:IgGFc-binding protein-like [Ambystoma mexicanum]|uniref:IgGFc-binding protein-like n=1 Tax=Ambystoma mexicanum TaxID=8296 RepID=UPI0037E8B03D